MAYMKCENEFIAKMIQHTMIASYVLAVYQNKVEKLQLFLLIGTEARFIPETQSDYASFVNFDVFTRTRCATNN